MTGLLDLATLDQRRAADPTASAWVSASAGSGKTKVLVDRLLNLLLSGAAPHKLLCLTYTKAAAAEMANRLSDILGGWVTLPEEKLADELRELTGAEAGAAMLARARRLFALVLDAPGGLRIQTLHAFAQSLLARFPLEAGIAPHFTVMDERDQLQLLNQALGELLAAARTGDDPELAAILARITSRIHETRFADLLRELTAGRARLLRLFEGLGGVDGTIAAIARHLGADPKVSEESLTADFCKDEAFDAVALRRAAQALCESSKPTDAERGPKMAAWLAGNEAERVLLLDDYLLAFITEKQEGRSRLATSEAKARMADIEDVLKAELRRVLAYLECQRAQECLQSTAALLRLAGRMLAAYRRMKQERARLDYDDLIQAARNLITGGTSWVLYKLDGGIDHVLIDEAQDTSPDQWDIVTAIAQEFFAGESARPQPRTLFAVGDVKQSIYSFQGADPDAFEAMRQRLARQVPDGGGRWEAVDLSVSFRSTRAVLEAVDAVFAEGEARAGVDLGPGYLRHHAARAEAGGSVELWPPVEPKEIGAPPAWRPPVEAIQGDSTQIRMAKLLARRIRAMLDGEILESQGRRIEAGDILILLRRRGSFAADLVRALKREDVPVAGVDRLVVTEQIAVADLMALARFVLLPEDDLNLAAVLKGPFLDFDEDRLFALCHGRKGHVWAQMDKIEPDARQWLARLMAEADRSGPFDFFSHLLGPLGGRRRITARMGPEALDAVDEFMNLALAYQAAHPPTLSGFLAWLDVGAVEIKRDPEPGQGGMVRLMTVHGAKGLQAPVVFLPDTLSAPQGRNMLAWSSPGAEGLPLWAPLSADRSEAVRAAVERGKRRFELEAHRLLYVAMTRAEDRLIVGGWRPRREAPGAWYPLIRQGFGRVAAQEVEDAFLAADPDGAPGRILRFSCPQREPAKSKRDSGKEIARSLLPDWARRPAPFEPKPPRPLIPSRPEGSEGTPLSFLGEEEARRFRRGLLVHRLLQTLPELAPGERAQAAQRYLAHAAADWGPQARDGLVGEVLSVMENKAFAPLFGADSKAEAPLAGLIGGRVLSGQVDRLALVENEVWIVDYKTNRPVPASPDLIPEAYRRQMQLYREAAVHLWPGRRIRSFLLWTDGPHMMEI